MVHNKFFVRASFLAGVGTWLCRGEPWGAAGKQLPSPPLPPGPSKLTWRKMCSLYLFTSPGLRRHHRLSRLDRTTCRASQSSDRIPMAWASLEVISAMRSAYVSLDKDIISYNSVLIPTQIYKTGEPRNTSECKRHRSPTSRIAELFPRGLQR